MGATLKLDLTSDVTHLIVGEINTAKYKFVARERADVTVLKPEWVEAVRQSWMQGEDTDVRGLEEQYKFPTFAGLCICITGFEDSKWKRTMLTPSRCILRLSSLSGIPKLYPRHSRCTWSRI